MYHAKILADSLSPAGTRLTTFEVTYPRFVHSEFLTHRELSRNSASSRAIPIEKMIQRVIDDPVLPVWWGGNQPGMQARAELAGQALDESRRLWLAARDEAVEKARALMAAGLHKQIVNRVLEPWMWITVIVSATQWSNFFALRCHPDAQPEIRKAAEMMRAARDRSVPIPLKLGEWHRPLLADLGELRGASHTEANLCKISIGRCARISYLTHDGFRDPAADVSLSDKLAASGHMSPFEHVAQALDTPECWGNFVGFKQYRKFLRNEHDFSLVRAGGTNRP